MRQIIIAGNWKMHKTTSEAKSLISELKEALASKTSVEVVVCPTFTSLAAASEAVDGTGLKLGAQTLFWKDKGAYTGQIAPSMLLDLGVTHVIIGHSEARGRFGVPEPDFDETILAYFGESDETVNRKTKAALGAGLVPIVCVGETLAERQSGVTDTVVAHQTERALAGIPAEDVSKVVFAYEPVWAIGTGEVCEPDEADRVCGVVRRSVSNQYGSSLAELVRVQYGGSVKPDNAKELLAKPNIDGALVGGASLKAGDFAAIVLAG